MAHLTGHYATHNVQNLFQTILWTLKRSDDDPAGLECKDVASQSLPHDESCLKIAPVAGCGRHKGEPEREIHPVNEFPGERLAKEGKAGS